MKKKILVFPCGSEIGLEIYRSINFSIHFEVFGGSSVDDHGMFVYKNYISGIPSVEDSSFIEEINKIIDEHKIDFIIPAHDSVLLKLAQAEAQDNLQCQVLTSPLTTCEIFRSKLRTYEFFENIIPVPRVHGSLDDLSDEEMPLFLKPEVGEGSKGTHFVRSKEEASFYFKKNPKLMILEYLPGKEYTVDCFTSRSGTLLFCEGRERKRTQNGISVNAFSVEDERFEQIASKINSNLQLRGAWFFQVKENNEGDFVLMEVAPRIAGTMALVRCKGVNLVLLSLFDAMGLDVGIFENEYELVLDRGLENKYKHNIDYKHVYLDFDDLVIIDGKVNPTVMAFVYQCMNNNVRVHLLTRHREDLERSLRKYKLSGVFDELLWVNDDDEKHNYVSEKKAIFIDDSFAERKKVHEACGIPVFDSHMIESLMEKV